MRNGRHFFTMWIWIWTKMESLLFIANNFEILKFHIHAEKTKKIFFMSQPCVGYNVRMYEWNQSFYIFYYHMQFNAFTFTHYFKTETFFNEDYCQFSFEIGDRKKCSFSESSIYFRNDELPVPYSFQFWFRSIPRPHY